MKYLLIYFTGTFNTRFLTSRVEEKLLKLGHSVERVEIDIDTKIVDATKYDRIGLSYPIYGFNAPRIFEKFLNRKVKVKKGQEYFIYKNSGETMAMNNASSRIMNRRFKRKGLKLIGEYHFVMPYNIHFPFDETFVKEILVKDEKLLDVMIYNLENGVIKTIKSNFIYNFAAFFVSIQKIGGDVNSFFYKVDESKCIKCNKCIKECPNHNIYINKKGKIKLNHHCEMCMRCSFYCPTNAFKIGFLEPWKVNGSYNLDKKQKELEKDINKDNIKYINNESKGFYKCFIKTFNEIDNDYKNIEPLLNKEEKTNK